MLLTNICGRLAQGWLAFPHGEAVNAQCLDLLNHSVMFAAPWQADADCIITVAQTRCVMSTSMFSLTPIVFPNDCSLSLSRQLPQNQISSLSCMHVLPLPEKREWMLTTITKIAQAFSVEISLLICSHIPRELFCSSFGRLHFSLR